MLNLESFIYQHAKEYLLKRAAAFVVSFISFSLG